MIEPVWRERKLSVRDRGKWREDSSRKERVKLQNLNILLLYLLLCRMMVHSESACDRKLVKSGGQRVRRAIRSRIYKEWRRDLCRVIYRFRWHIAISLHGYRYILSTSESEYRFLSPSSFFSFLSYSEYILLYYIGCFSPSFLFYLLSETWFT